jgi:hypothetical protein
MRKVARKKPVRTKADLNKAKIRSAISNGTHVLRDVDHRLASMRRLRDCLQAHISDLGGIDNVSHAQRVLAGRAAMLTVLAEMQEREWAADQMKAKQTAIDLYIRTVGTLRRVCESLGLKREARTINGPTLGDLLAHDIESQRQHNG